jgi:hypothetical protein
MRIKYKSMYRIFQLITQALSPGLLPSSPSVGVLGVFMSPKNRKKRLLTNHYVELLWLFCKTYFSAEFRSVPIFGIGSSAEIGMPRNEQFLPRNNGNHSESIPRNFFGTKFRSQP